MRRSLARWDKRRVGNTLVAKKSLDKAAGAREAEGLDVRLSAFSASNWALIFECGTASSWRIKPLNCSREITLYVLGRTRGAIRHNKPSEMRVIRWCVQVKR